jgi:hypothetical protein
MMGYSQLQYSVFDHLLVVRYCWEQVTEPGLRSSCENYHWKNVVAAFVDCSDLVDFVGAWRFVHSLGKLSFQIEVGSRTLGEREYHGLEADRWLHNSVVLQASHLHPANVDIAL